MIRMIYLKENEDEIKTLKISLGRVMNMEQRPFHEVHKELSEDGWVNVPINDYHLSFC